MRFLYLDDYGKIYAKDPAKFFVLAGFSLAEGRWHQVVRQVSGAKGNFLAANGKPSDWEIKSTDFLPPNAWKRARRRGLCLEIVNILKRNHCHVYSVSLDKSKAKDALSEEKFFPLAMQRLVAQFHSEILDQGESGSVVCDWWDYRMDRHTTSCISSSIISKKMELIRGGVTFGSSAALVPLQVADIIAGTIGRYLSGGTHLLELINNLEDLRFRAPGQLDVFDHPVDSVCRIF